MKLYTEEQVKAIILKSRLTDLTTDSLMLFETPIELPSRDMAEEAFTNSSLSDSKEGKIDFLNGFIWTIRQILNQTK